MSVFRLGGVIGMAESATDGWHSAITAVDAYSLDDPATRAQILAGAGIIISGAADHLQLAKYRAELTEFVATGGRLLVNGQVVVPFVDGLSRWSRLEYRNAADVRPHAVTAHPVWAGVDYRDLHYRTGVPGVHSYEELGRIGVAGFYGRGYHANLPDGARVVTGIGPLSLPLDYAFTLGTGEVLVHGGLDLEGFADDRYSTTAMGPNLVAWLTGGTRTTPTSRTTPGTRTTPTSDLAGATA